MGAIIVGSPAFGNGRPIPAEFTCDGDDVSPPLSWSGVPAAAKSLAIVCDDPDAPAGTWVHWVTYDIPPDRDSLERNIPKHDSLPGIGTQGTNDFGRTGYNGPCGPPGETHRYFFRVYALDAALGLPAKKTGPEIETAMKGHILARGDLMGTCSRKK